MFVEGGQGGLVIDTEMILKIAKAFRRDIRKGEEGDVRSLLLAQFAMRRQDEFDRLAVFEIKGEHGNTVEPFFLDDPTVDGSVQILSPGLTLFPFDSSHCSATRAHARTTRNYSNALA